MAVRLGPQSTLPAQRMVERKPAGQHMGTCSVRVAAERA